MEDFTTPVLMSDLEERVLKLVRKIQKKEIKSHNELTKKDHYLLLEMVAGTDESLKKKIKNQYLNHPRLKDDTLCKKMPELFAEMFFTILFWEMYGSDSEEYFQSSSETTRNIKVWSRRFPRTLKEMKAMEHEIDAMMEDKGVVREEDVVKAVAEAKEEVHQARDKERIDIIKQSKKKDIIIADLKRERLSDRRDNEIVGLTMERDHLLTEVDELRQKLSKYEPLEPEPE